ncbi:MAG: tRNA (N6-threonylcarbamoyladenosine(37)-N6)-methyltransferase TrmO [Deltaproteobacteria bacterium GWD2_55_8]|nr:MAG: tRNA (N6-threonylcarbamoyladenosine(37)-N6)-methyltransferase TrmO [Deltaproteobacteria bacterium GWD2_55_8]
MNIEPIGTVKSPVTEAGDEGWGGVVSEIHLQESLAAGLQGIEQFSHIIVIFFMHQSTFDLAADLVRRPRERPDMPLVGTFAQRAKHRPNPIGITTVQLIRVEGNILEVKGLDAIDGTPVLDIKPYVPAFDCGANAVVPGWVEKLMKGYF